MKKWKIGRSKVIFFIFILLLFTTFLVTASKTAKKVDSSIACRITDFSGEVDPTQRMGFFEGRDVAIPELALNTDTKTRVLGSSSAEKWIEIDLSDQTLKAWEGDSLFLQTLVSTGLPWFATPKGEYNIWSKMRATRMEGGEGKYYYNLPNVPYVMFFENDKVPSWRGYSLHGTYWHNDFGKVHSHGCVNLPTSMAEKLYYWTSPQMPEGKSYVRVSKDNPGTRIVIHE